MVTLSAALLMWSHWHDPEYQFMVTQRYTLLRWVGQFKKQACRTIIIYIQTDPLSAASTLIFFSRRERSALAGRASPLRGSEGLHAQSPVLYSAACISRAPTKLLFNVDDGWNLFLEKFGDSISPWTRLSVERMLTCSTACMGVRRFCCSSPDCTHSRFFCQSCKSKT